MAVTIILFSILLVCFLGFLATIYWLFHLNSQKRLKGRLNDLVDVKTAGEKQSSQDLSTKPTLLSSTFAGVREKFSGALAFLSNNELRQKIASAYWPISDSEFIFIRIVISLAGLLLGWAISRSILGGLGLGVLFYVIPGIVLDRSIVRRRKKFQDQLVDFLVLIRGAILSGNSLPQALDMAIKEMPAPISEEFNQVLREIKFGIPLDEALHNLTVRMQGDDLQIVVTAIIINSQMGGNLSTILEATIDTVRDRMQLLSEVRSLTSYPRLVGLLLTLLPFILALVIYLIRPGFFDPVKTSLISKIILLMALIGIVIGNIVIRLITRIRV